MTNRTPIEQLLERVRAEGVEPVAMHPDRLLFDGHLPDDLVVELKARGREVVAAVNAGGAPREDRPRAPQPETPAPAPPAGGRDLRGELEDEDGEFPPAWRPSVGEILVEAVVPYDESTTPYGRAVICQIADESTGEVFSVWLLHHVLLDEFRKLRPKPGERVGIKRLPDADHYKKFRVRVDRPDEGVPDLLKVGAQEGLPAANPPHELPGAGSAPAPEPELSEPDDDLPF